MPYTRNWNAGFGVMPNKRRKVVDHGEYQQLTKTRDSFGRSKTKDSRLMTMLRAHMTTYVDRWQKCSQGNALTGQMFLSYTFPTADTTIRQLPLYMMNLDCMPNWVVNPVTGTAENSGPINMMRRLYMNTDVNVAPKANSYYTVGVAGKDNADADLAAVNNTWLTEERYVQDRNAGPHQVLNWVDLRMMLYGATDRPSRVQVSLVQFTDHEMCPTSETYGTTTANTWQENEEPTDQPDATDGSGPWRKWNDLWDGLTDRLVGNPIAHRGTSSSGKYLKTLYSKEFVFNPISKDEQDARGHMKEFYLRYKCDRHLNLSDAGQTLDANGNPIFNNHANVNQWAINDRTGNVCYVQSNKRIYLMISGMTMEASASTTTVTGGTATVAPSFDIIVRRKRTAMHR